jgi:hypothetical protein
VSGSVLGDAVDGTTRDPLAVVGTAPVWSHRDPARLRVWNAWPTAPSFLPWTHPVRATVAVPPRVDPRSRL